MASKTAEKGERRRARSHAAATPAQNEAAVARPATFNDSKIGDHGIIPSAKNSEIMLMLPDMPESRSLRNPVTKTSRRETAETVLEASGGRLSGEERNLPVFLLSRTTCTGPHPSLASSKAFVPVSTHWLQHSLKRIALEMNPLKKATCRQRSAPLSRFPSLQDISAFPHL